MKTVSFYISEEASAVVDALVIAERKATGGDVNRSTVANALFLKATPTPIKRIVPVFEITARGRKKLVAFEGWYGDYLVDVKDTEAAARKAVDDYAYEELSK